MKAVFMGPHVQLLLMSQVYNYQSDLVYGETEGQLGRLKEGDVDGVCDAAVSSPPWENQEPSHAQNDTPSKRRLLSKANPGAIDSEYGNSNGQLGNSTGETFWSAARTILEQTYAILKPNGVAAWIVKDYVKAGKRVPFADNWAKLCEATGFQVIERARAWLVKEETHPGLFGNVTKKTERKSFFRRLHERKPGAIRIDWEEVVFVRKPIEHA